MAETIGIGVRVRDVPTGRLGTTVAACFEKRSRGLRVWLEPAYRVRFLRFGALDGHDEIIFASSLRVEPALPPAEPRRLRR